MKKWAFLFCAGLIVIGCNDDGTKPGIAEMKAVSITETALKEAVSKYPDSSLLKERLIQYYRDRSQDTLAMSLVDAAIKDNPANARWWHIKAQLYDESNDTVNVIKSWENAIAILPDPLYLLQLGYLYANLKNQRAVIIADTLINAYKSKFAKEALLIKGIYQSKTDKHKAIQLFDQALNLSYTFMEAYREKAIALYELGKYNDAVKVLERALTVDVAYDEAYYWLGRNYEKLGNSKEAIANYKQAIQVAVSRQEDYPEAEEALQKLEKQ